MLGTIKYSLCQQHREGQSLICLQSQCKHQRLICNLCKQLQHSSHKSLPVKIFIQELTKRKASTKTSQQFLQKIDQVHAESMHLLKNALVTVSNQIRQFQQLLLAQHFRFKGLINKINNLPNLTQIVQNTGSSNQLNEEMVDTFVDCFKADDASSKISMTSLEDISLNFHEIMKKNNQCISSTFSQIIALVQDSVLSVKAKSSCLQQKFVFSQTLKGPNIQVNGPIALQTSPGSTSPRICLIDPALSIKTPSEISFKIIGIKGLVGVGIAYKSIAQKKNYMLDTKQDDHGHVLLCSNGFLWNHGIPEQNNVNKGMPMVAGDIIKIIYNPEQNKLIFQNTSQSKTKKLRVMIKASATLLTPENVRFAVNLMSKGDSVELV